MGVLGHYTEYLLSHLFSSLWGFRVRLSEGFHFACSGEGIINMVLELPIQVCATPHDTSPQGPL